jgi:hypothetical protein
MSVPLPRVERVGGDLLADRTVAVLAEEHDRRTLLDESGDAAATLEDEGEGVVTKAHRSWCTESALEEGTALVLREAGELEPEAETALQGEEVMCIEALAERWRAGEDDREERVLHVELAFGEDAHLFERFVGEPLRFVDRDDEALEGKARAEELPESLGRLGVGAARGHVESLREEAGERDRREARLRDEVEVLHAVSIEAGFEEP